MLEDVILTEKVRGKSVSILLYSIDIEDRVNEDNHKQFYEVRVSHNDKLDNWYTDTEVYRKRDALRIHKVVCKEIEAEFLQQVKVKNDKVIAKKQILSYVA